MSKWLCHWRPATLLGLALALASCGGEEEILVLTCPQVLIVEEASDLTLYTPGEGRDMLDVRFGVGIQAVEWVCEFYADENKVDVEVRFGMRALRGPAAEGSVARFPYFAAVADPQGNILAKQVFAIDIEFPGNAIEIGHIEAVFQRLRYTSIAEASKYTIYLGFQLTPEQLMDARARNGL